MIYLLAPPRSSSALLPFLVALVYLTLVYVSFSMHSWDDTAPPFQHNAASNHTSWVGVEERNLPTESTLKGIVDYIEKMDVDIDVWLTFFLSALGHADTHLSLLEPLCMLC